MAKLISMYGTVDKFIIQLKADNLEDAIKYMKKNKREFDNYATLQRATADKPGVYAFIKNMGR